MPFTVGQEYGREIILQEKDNEFAFQQTELEVPGGQPGGDVQNVGMILEM